MRRFLRRSLPHMRNAGRTWPQLGTNEYPWYASTRVLSPRKFGDWESLMPDVADELEVFASGAERRELV
jgi:hypothetical protein